MRLIEFERTGAGLADALDDRFAVLREDDQLRLALAVAEADDDLAVRRHDDVVRLEAAVGRDGAARFPERHQHSPVGAELEDLVSFGRAGQRARRCGAAPLFTAGPPSAAARSARGTLAVVLAVGHPDVAVLVDVDA